MSLVNVSLKLRSLNIEIYVNIFAEKSEKLLHLQKLLTFFQQNTCELSIVLTRTVNILITNEIVKLTML